MEMNCERARRAIGPDVGPMGITPEVDAALSHYRACDSCQAFYAGQRALVARLARLRDHERAPDTLRSKILSAVASDLASRPVRRRRWFTSAVAAAAVAALLAIWVGTRTSTDGTAAVFVAMSQSDPDRVLTTDAPGELQDWFLTTVGHSIEIPSIPDARLTRGRITPFDGMLAAVIDYDMGGMELTYFMIPTDRIMRNRRLEDGLASLSTDGYQVVLWQEGSTSRALVAPMARSRIRAIADHCRNKSMI